jgi:rare lipoprotein A (peptidoglycan hydrolase)
MMNRMIFYTRPTMIPLSSLSAIAAQAADFAGVRTTSNEVIAVKRTTRIALRQAKSRRNPRPWVTSQLQVPRVDEAKCAFNPTEVCVTIAKHMSKLRLIGLFTTTLVVTSCSDLTPVKKESIVVQKNEPKVSKPEPKVKKPVPKKVEKPKESALKTYYGLASWYSIQTNRGRTTASGRLLTNGGRTAAHKTLPFGSRVRVTSLFNGKSEILHITDRGPYVKGRVVDVTIGSAQRLGFYSRGLTRVKVEVLSYGNWQYKRG